MSAAHAMGKLDVRTTVDTVAVGLALERFRAARVALYSARQLLADSPGDDAVATDLVTVDDRLHKLERCLRTGITNSRRYRDA